MFVLYFILGWGMVLVLISIVEYISEFPTIYKVERQSGSSRLVAFMRTLFGESRFKPFTRYSPVYCEYSFAGRLRETDIYLEHDKERYFYSLPDGRKIYIDE